MRHLTAADFLRTPWKNGGGETVQLAIFPDGASLDDFAWRISMAGVDRDGPFSHFAGVERSLSILSGEGLILDIDGVRHEMAVASPPLRFSGETTTSARLVSGPVTDFNVMSRRGLSDHAVSRMTPGEALAANTDFAFVFALTPSRVAGIDLAPGDLLALDFGEVAALETGAALAIKIISLANAT